MEPAADLPKTREGAIEALMAAGFTVEQETGNRLVIIGGVRSANHRREIALLPLFPDVDTLHLRVLTATDHDLVYLQALANLRELWLISPKIEGPGLKYSQKTPEAHTFGHCLDRDRRRRAKANRQNAPDRGAFLGIRNK